jgi:hypothetical protein
MISFKQFLSETAIKKWDVEHIGLEGLVTLLNAQFKSGLESIKNGSILFRGLSGGKNEADGYKIIDTTKAHRTSRDTNNIYQLLMDNSAGFKDYPKRKNSLICSTGLTTAENYGTVNVLIPIDGTKIAALKHPDIFSQSLHTPLVQSGIGVQEVSNEIEMFLRELGLRGNKVFDDMQVLDDFLTNVAPDKIIKAISDSETGNCFNYTECLKLFSRCLDDKKMTTLANALFSPTSMDIRLLTAGDDIPPHNQLGVEAWFSGVAVSMPLATFADMLYDLKKSGFPVHKSFDKYMKLELKKAAERYDAQLRRDQSNE